MGFQRQVVAFNALSENIAGQMLILRHLLGITPPVVAVIMPMLKGVSCASNLRQVSSVLGPKM